MVPAGLAAAPDGSVPDAAAPAYPWEKAVWQQAAGLLVGEALAQLPLPRAAGSAAECRALDHARGVLLLNAQPKYQGNIDEARALLQSVRQSRADDDLGLSALYYLARIAQFHTSPPDPARAAQLYAELIARAPAHPLAQEAVAKLATLRLFEDGTVPDERRRRLDEYETAAAHLQAPGARRDLYFVLAESRLLFAGDREPVLRDLLAAEQAGIVRQQLAADTLARIAVLARELGHREIAIEHYQKFLASFQRDNRAYLLGGQLKALQAETPTANLENVPAAVPASSPAP